MICSAPIAFAVATVGDNGDNNNNGNQMEVENDGDRLNSAFRINQAADDRESENLDNGNRDSQSENEIVDQRSNFEEITQNNQELNQEADKSSDVDTVETKNFVAGQDDNKNSANAGVDMKETGMPIVAILLVLLSCIGIGVFKKQK